MTTLFISDLHLDPQRPAITELFGRFLDGEARHAEALGFNHVLSAGVDVPDLPRDLATSLAGEGAAIVESQPVVGLWLDVGTPERLAEADRLAAAWG